ncbi:hypothetical protein FIBSPDRAFT_739983 [Athelia psychrophila]|uniref:Uncharacterized protein n=1 Tax=Athelia psychrophila TaxID=1759441 RepID=A0A166KEW5_9AGAM|nr:hypothetical protein FIBSPDRAFT_739983 [Fibularhizoctonia sp. CBS 109695]
MEALQMLKFSITRGRRLDFTAGSSRKDELLEMETCANIETSVPDNVGLFIQALYATDDS